MASPIQGQIILCDAAQADPNGKIHILGGGWSVTGSPTAPQAIAVLLKVPWDRTNEKIHVTLRLLDSDGHPVTLPTPQGEQPVRIESDVEVGRPPGVAHGSNIPAAFAVNIAPMPLAPGRYVWEMRAGDTVRDEAFQVVGSAPNRTS
ncbi:MAG TPA: hypothetical protein VG317_22790 [Pseudonocardiaceae bacterium]|jgi:hypothetical protein|nr:hypothetical protein [Pseudonocardiaceae bacterium]